MVQSRAFTLIRSYWREIISIITLFILIYATFYSQPNANKQLRDELQQIAVNTYSPKPYLVGNAQCYIFEPDDARKYFSSNNSNSYYADVYSLRAAGAFASNPWIKIAIPEDIKYAGIKSAPEGTQTIKDDVVYGEKVKTISVSWDTKIPPDGEVKVIIFYEKEYISPLKSKQRIYTFGSQESTGYTTYNNCNNIEIFSGFK